MRKNKYHMYLTAEEMRTVVKALVDVRNSLNIAKWLTYKVESLLSEKSCSENDKTTPTFLQKEYHRKHRHKIEH